MLQRVKAQIPKFGGLGMAINRENSALIVELIEHTPPGKYNLDLWSFL
jgi:hypothetical protein